MNLNIDDFLCNILNLDKNKINFQCTWFEKIWNWVIQYWQILDITKAYFLNDQSPSMAKVLKSFDFVQGFVTSKLWPY